MVLLLTGGGGHVGEGVAKAAAKRGLIVVATYRGAKPPATACELGDTVHWVACDLTDKDSVKKLATAYDIQQCIHCAAVPNEAFARPDPLGALKPMFQRLRTC